MASSSKYIKLHQDVLLEWVYDTNNLKQDDYQVVQDLVVDKRGYMSKTGLNRVENTIIPIDPVIRKYAKVDPSKYNYLKLESYSTSYVQFDKLRIHLPTTYSFADSGYIGLHMRIYTYDYDNKKVVDFSSMLYDDTSIGSDSNIVLNEEFLYDEQNWGKYLTFDIPSIDAVSKQRTSTVGTDLPLSNSINLNLTQSKGISTTSPIFIEFTFVVSRQEILGNTYYHMSDLFTKSISKVPEYLNLASNISQAIDGDYFEIYGSYGGSNESMDEFVDELKAKGRKVRIEYEVTLFEENILMNTQTFTVTENFTKKLWYRPVLSFTNTTASIDVTMKVIDLVDSSQIDRLSSISLTTDVFKYGKLMTRINLDNAWKPKIYNKKATSGAIEIPSQATDISLTKVNYPVISDRIDILVSSSPSSSSKYKPMGLAEIIINPFGNIVKFNIASDVDARGNATPYNLTKITENSQITLSFKNDVDMFEKNMWQETDLNDFENGIVVFKIDQQDLQTIKKIGLKNKNFYITIKSEKTGVRSLLYSGKWVNFEDVTFLNTTTNETTGFDFGDFTDLGLSAEELQSLLDSAGGLGSGTNLNNPNTNALVFLKSDANVKIFEDYLNSIQVNIHIKKPGGNSNSLTFLYFLLNVSPATIEDIKINENVTEVISLPFCLGSDIGGGSNVNLTDIKNRVLDFNCANADLLKTQANSQNNPTQSP